MTRVESTGIAYDSSLDALTNPGAADNFFQLHRPQSEAAWCAEFSRLAYCDYGRVLAPSLAAVGFHLVVSPFDHAGTQAFLAEGPDFAVLTFRGSDDLDAWTTNLDAMPAPWRGPGKVHHGFAKALEAVWQEITQALPDRQRRLLVTGHSLGAALATLAAAIQSQVHLYTFGSPRVGDEAFRDAVAAIAVRAERYINNRDLVCRLPSERFGYRHVGATHFIDREGRVHDRAPEDESLLGSLLDALPVNHQRLDELFRGTLPRELSDHAPINYVSALS